MYHYIKKYLLVLFVLLMPTMNIASKALDPDEHPYASGMHKRQLPQEEQKTVLSSVKHLASSEVASLEDSKRTWRSYVPSSKTVLNTTYSVLDLAATPVKTVVKNTCLLLDFATQSPQNAFMVACLALPCVEAAVQYCQCICINYKTGKTFPAGGYPNQTICVQECDSIGMNFYYCSNN